MARCVRTDPLLAGTAEDLREIADLVAGTVVSDDPMDEPDAVSSEERTCPLHEIDSSAGFLVAESSGVCQPGVAVDRGVQEHITRSAAALLGAGGDFGLLGTRAVHAPATTVGDPADLLHIDVDHMPWPAGQDPARNPVAVASRVDESAAVQPQMRQLAGHGPHRNIDPGGVELERDPSRRPLVVPPHPFDLGHDHRRGR